MKIKVSEATGIVLDWMVAKCEGYNSYSPNNHNFSTCWNKGGPIIERERITTWFEGFDDVDSAIAIWGAQKFGIEQHLLGDTTLEAAMRCYVASKLGAEVEVLF